MLKTDSVKSFVKKYSHTLALSYYLVVFLWFSYLEQNVKPKYFMFSKVDNYIPFIKEFIIPYFLWFAYIALALIYLGLKSRQDFLKLCLFMFSGMTVCFIVYTVLPNGQNLRPEVVGNDIFSGLVRWIYQNDTPTNSAPSMHVLDSLAVHFALINYEGFRSRKLLKAASLTLAISIILSTVFVKQHSFVDLIYGLMLGIILYILIYKIDYRKPILLHRQKAKLQSSVK